MKQFNNKIYSHDPVFIICECGVTNYGEIELAKRQIDAAYNAGADAIKFQVSKTENLISKKISNRMEDELGFNWFNRTKYKEFTFDEVRELKSYAQTGGLPFFATAHEEESFDFLDKEINQPFHKIGSGEAHNYEYLKKVGSMGKKVFISFGLQSDTEVVKAIETLRGAGAFDIVPLHTVTKYPTPYSQVNLPRINHLKELLGLPIGISDHSIGWHVILAAVALGACAVEKHLTFGKNDPRSLDNPGALLPSEFKQMVKEIRDLENALQQLTEEERLSLTQSGRDWAGQCIVASRNIPEGSILTKDMIVFKRPSRGGLAPDQLENILGKKVIQRIPQDEQIKFEYLS